jgi:hypothetical protein
MCSHEHDGTREPPSAAGRWIVPSKKGPNFGSTPPFLWQSARHAPLPITVPDEKVEPDARRRQFDHATPPRGEDRHGLRGVRSGTLDDTSWLRPTVHFWTRNKPPWIILSETDQLL